MTVLFSLPGIDDDCNGTARDRRAPCSGSGCRFKSPGLNGGTEEGVEFRDRGGLLQLGGPDDSVATNLKGHHHQVLRGEPRGQLYV
jgi:hypothetical protein